MVAAWWTRLVCALLYWWQSLQASSHRVGEVWSWTYLETTGECFAGFLG